MSRSSKDLRPAITAVLILLLFALASTPSLAFAQGNLVRIEPSGVEVAPGGTFTIAVVDEPPPESTAVWAVDVSFDSGVVTVRDPDHDCDTLDPPPGSTSASICQGADADGDGATDTIKVIGFVLFSGTEKGLTEETTLADIMFAAVGSPGQCSDLRLRIRSHADSEGNETGAQVQDGRVCIKGDAPQEGTATDVPVTPRTSEPTESPSPGPGATSRQTSSGDQNGGSAGGGAGGSSVGTGGSPNDASGGSDSTGREEGPSSSSNDSDGDSSPFVWIGIIAASLALAGAGAAWWLIRVRGAKPPGT
jgi:hypothetical protein